MSMLGRWRAYQQGHRLLRLGLVASPREGGYMFINSPDLPGFSIMLSPSETEDFDAFVAALGKPLVAFVSAEYKASQALKDGAKVHLRDMDPLRGTSKFYAELCTA